MAIAPGSSVGEEAATVDTAATDGAVAVAGRTPWEIVRLRLRRDKVTLVAFVASVIFVLLAIAAPILDALGIIDPLKFNDSLVQGLGGLPEGAWSGASWEHPLGVEPGTGRDILARILVGMTTSLTVALLATIVSLVLGTVLGIVAGYSRGRLDWFLSRFNDLVLSFPQTLMLISLSTIVTTQIANLIGRDPSDNTAKIAYMALVLGVFGIPIFSRIIRGQVLSLREREFIEAAKSLGAGRGRIYFKELLPHLWAPLLVYTTLVLPANISAEAALGFLGVGLTPPTPSFGVMLNDSVAYTRSDTAYFFTPAFVVFLMVLSFNLLGDGLRDALDPKAGRS